MHNIKLTVLAISVQFSGISTVTVLCSLRHWAFPGLLCLPEQKLCTQFNTNAPLPPVASTPCPYEFGSSRVLM